MADNDHGSLVEIARRSESAQQIGFDDVLNYIRNADRDSWHLISEEIRLHAFYRALRAAQSFRIGEIVSLMHWDGSRRITGQVTRIDRRRGRLAVLADFGDGRPAQYALPATMVMGSPTSKPRSGSS